MAHPEPSPSPDADSPSSARAAPVARSRGALAARGLAGRRASPVGDPDAPSVRAAAARFGAARGAPGRRSCADADLVVVATPDRAIDAVAAGDRGRGRPRTRSSSTSRARAALDALDARSPARTGALHPLQSLPDPELGAARLAGCVRRGRRRRRGGGARGVRWA